MERQSPRRGMLVGAIVVCILGAGGALLWGKPRAPQAAEGSAASASPSGAAVAPSTGHEQPAAAAAAAAKDSSALPPSAVQKTPELPAIMPADLIEQVLKEDKKLGMFMYYHKHVLLDEQGRNEYRKILADPETIAEMSKALKEPGRGEVEPKEHYHRLMQTDFFEAALNWKENPQREELIGEVGSIILTDNFSSGQDSDRRQMLAGGKMELYRLMYDADVSKALDMVAQAKGTRMEPLVDWMAQENLRRRAKEEQIRAEMQEMQTRAEVPAAKP